MAHDFAGHARIAREASTPISAAINWWGVRDMQQAIAAAASDYMRPDVMKIGGSPAAERRGLGEAHGIKSPTTCGRRSARTDGGDATAHWLDTPTVESDPARPASGE